MRLLLLIGSRASGEEREDSDWDFAYLAEKGFEPEFLHQQLVVQLRNERVDLVDLETASALLRYRAAADGRVVLDEAGEFRRFWLQAVGFWCDVEPVIRGSYARVLERVSR